MNNDASASWHGFEYQGKVTLYQVLKRINDLLEEGKSEEISRYSFLVEGEEDFDIYEDNDLIELNQVKAQYTKKNVSGYMEAISKLYLRDSAKSDVSLKFHTVVEITDWNDNFEHCFSVELANVKKKISDKETKIEKKKKEVNNKKTKIEDSKTKKETKVNLEKECMKIEKECKKLSGDSEKLKKDCQKLEDAGAGVVKSKVELVVYEINGNKNYYCCSDTIEELIKLEIEKYFSLTNQKHKENDVHKFLIYLFFEVSKHIKERSEKKVTEKKISFQHICGCLNNNKVLENDDLYYYGLILNRFLDRSFSSYCRFHCPKTKECDRNSCDLKDTLFMKLKKMDIKSAYDLLRKMYPHKILENISLTNDAFNDESIMFIYDEFSKEYFYDFLHYHLQDNYYFVKKNKLYFPTAIANVNDRRKESSIEEYKSNIKQNIENKKFDIEKLYELDYLVTDNLENKGVFISDHLDIEQDLIREEDYDSEQKRNRYIINLRKIKDVREDLEK
ncbi:ABC-three component system protein [Enterococcus plantarum]|uniref:ABC-three component system protein n=1 Tax=Enterococcus plantarum TaxID=1077675 RepID=UPI001A8FC4E7|nr:ABC-three component system protein [Enterococcus plantarum]MBO0422185.1 hypothetical protein [Enterococcus plantarum]